MYLRLRRWGSCAQGKMGFFEQSYHIPCIIADPRPAADASRGSVVEAFSE